MSIIELSLIPTWCTKSPNVMSSENGYSFNHGFEKVDRDVVVTASESLIGLTSSSVML